VPIASLKNKRKQREGIEVKKIRQTVTTKREESDLKKDTSFKKSKKRN